ncbi:MAG: hypothetical protein NC548_33285 [Lachnospiraceae bacterium]|nr:hypothetical protein [Lachnospiraceae bacterium]
MTTKNKDSYLDKIKDIDIPDFLFEIKLKDLFVYSVDILKTNNELAYELIISNLLMLMMDTKTPQMLLDIFVNYLSENLSEITFNKFGEYLSRWRSNPFVCCISAKLNDEGVKKICTCTDLTFKKGSDIFHLYE